MALNELETYFLYAHKLTTTNVTMKATMTLKEEKFDKFSKISPLHSYKIHQHLQPPPFFGGAPTPPKGPAPTVATGIL